MAEEKSSAGYGALDDQPKPQSLLSGPPQTSQRVTTPKVVESSSVSIVKETYDMSKLVIYIYIVFGVVALGVTIAELAAAWNPQALFLIICLLTIGLALAGAYGVYRWGTVQEQIDRFEGENKKYESELVLLRSSKERIASDVQGISESNALLQKDVDELNKTYHEYDDLRKQLEEIAGDNEDINEMIGTLNGMCGKMKSAVVQNQRASILKIFYDVQFRDKNEGMSEGEYRRFHGKLDKETRARFDKYGNFERLAGDDGIISLVEFQEALERILLDMEEELLREAGKKKQ
mmetsp:Transcript_19325/g.30649  ORF Transcript_19325/g.30649 Transcript_19325/m.30649 type:complete len:291 (-) Transcript_19325:96-968(-)